MSVMEAPVVEHVTDFVPDSDPNKMAHIVIPAHLVTEAHVMGTPVTALCGYVWVPSRAADPFPVCQRCVEVYEESKGPWIGRR